MNTAQRTFLAVLTPLLAATGWAADVPEPIARHADNVIRHARDVYGPVSSPLLVCQLDLETMALPPAESKVYATTTRGGAGPTMNNLQFDSGRLRLLYALAERTGESRYAQAADDYLDYYLAHLPDEKTGFFPWGDHRGYDVVADETIPAQHEFKCTFPPWEEFYRINPRAVTREIESLRRHIIDPERSLGFNRHEPPGSLPHSMSASGGAYIAAWAFLYQKTGDRKYRDWALAMAEYLWSLRNPTTDLLAAHPFDPAYPEMADSPRAVARAARTEYMGQITWFSANLLHAARLLGPQEGAPLVRQALAYYRAFTGRMDVAPDGSFFATFDLKTGRPLFPRIETPWQIVPQLSPPENWSNGVVGARAFFSLAFAYKTTGEEDLREAADRLIPGLRIDQLAAPADEPPPISAGLLAQVMVGMLDFYQKSGEARYLEQAEQLSRVAMRHYYRDGWFVCGLPTVPRYRDPAIDVWRLYSNRGGSDDLALAVLRVWLAWRGEPDVAVDDVGAHF